MSVQQLAFAYADLPNRRVARHTSPRSFVQELIGFREFGTKTRQIETRLETVAKQFSCIPTFVNEFWTARQRQASSLHEVSYRACFKPQLPRFFIERLTPPGDVVYDPFMGRGTTPLETALLGRVPWGNDINPLSLTFTRPRLRPPALDEVAARLREINFEDHDEFPEELLAFYQPETLRELCALKKYLLTRQGKERGVHRRFRVRNFNHHSKPRYSRKFRAKRAQARAP